MEVSLWQHDLPNLPCFPTLCGDLRCEVAVVGAGMTGLLTAFALRENGIDTVVLEADLPGSGSTAFTTGSIMVAHGYFFSALINALGPELARRYAARQLSAVERYGQLTEQLSISCGFQRLPAFLYASKKTRRLKEEFCAAQQVGIPAHWTQKTELPFPTFGAIVLPDQACLNPLQFLYGLVPHLRIFAHSPVEQLKNGILYTAGGRVRANHIVVTTSLPFLPFSSRKASWENYCALSLEGTPPLSALYQDTCEDGHSLRPHLNGLLLSGRVRTMVPAPFSDPPMLLQRTAKEWFPDSRVTAAWTGCESSIRGAVPYVNAYVGRKADLYLAAGFSGWSMTAAMVASQFICDRISAVRTSQI